jgi:hypothetical protein
MAVEMAEMVGGWRFRGGGTDGGLGVGKDWFCGELRRMRECRWSGAYDVQTRREVIGVVNA